MNFLMWFSFTHKEAWNNLAIFYCLLIGVAVIQQGCDSGIPVWHQWKQIHFCKTVIYSGQTIRDTCSAWDSLKKMFNVVVCNGPSYWEFLITGNYCNKLKRQFHQQCLDVNTMLHPHYIVQTKKTKKQNTISPSPIGLGHLLLIVSEWGKF